MKCYNLVKYKKHKKSGKLVPELYISIFHELYDPNIHNEENGFQKCNGIVKLTSFNLINEPYYGGTEAKLEFYFSCNVCKGLLHPLLNDCDHIQFTNFVKKIFASDNKSLEKLLIEMFIENQKDTIKYVEYACKKMKSSKESELRIKNINNAIKRAEEELKKVT